VLAGLPSLSAEIHNLDQGSEESVMKPLMNLDDVEFDDIEENGIYTSSRAPCMRLGAGQPGATLEGCMSQDGPPTRAARNHRV
jgi:hypothetical protein